MLYVFAVMGLILVYVFFEYNGLVHLKNSFEESFATMDVYLKKRRDLIPNLIETVKGYMTYEQGTLEKVVLLRNKAMQTGGSTGKGELENELSHSLKSLFALSENYPELKADTQFLELQKQLNEVEMDIANARKYYNGVAKALNTRMDSLPTKWIAPMLGFTKVDYFVIDDASRDTVAVKF